MKYLLMVSGLLLGLASASVAQDNARAANPPKDRTYWQNPKNVRTFKKQLKKKKDCDCPSEMTAKQRRKYRFRS